MVREVWFRGDEGKEEKELYDIRRNSKRPR